METNTSPAIISLIDAQDRALARADAVTAILCAVGADLEGFDVPHLCVTEAIGLIADLIDEARACTRGIDGWRMTILAAARENDAHQGDTQQ